MKCRSCDLLTESLFNNSVYYSEMLAEVSDCKLRENTSGREILSRLKSNINSSQPDIKHPYFQKHTFTDTHLCSCAVLN